MNARLHVPAALALAAVLVATRAAPAGGAPPAAWHVALWSFDDDVARPGFAAAAKSLGADSASAFRTLDLAPLRRAGLSWYEDVAAGSRTLCLAREEKDWKPAWDEAWEARATAWPGEKARKRPVCLRDSAVAKEMERLTIESAKRAATGAFAISLEDEPSMTVRANPVDWCLCDCCVAAFRDSMRAKYVDLAALNAAWATDYASWEAVRPWTTAAVKDRVRDVDPAKWNLAPWIEARAFQDATYAALLAHLRDVAAKEAPGVPCGITGTQAPSAFGGWDYARLGTAMNFVEPYDIGLALPICRDLMPPGAVIAQTVFPSQGDGFLASRWRLWRGVARGARATIVWSSHDALTREGACALTDYGRAIAPDLAALTAEGGVGAGLARAQPIGGDAVLVLSQPSICVRWMLDSVEDGWSWMRRFGSYEATRSTGIKRREAAWRALAASGARFVDDRAIVAPNSRSSPLAGHRVVAPDLLCLSSSQRAELTRLLDSGAVPGLVTDGPVGAYDELGRATPEFRHAKLVVDPGFAQLAKDAKPPARLPTCRIERKDGGAAPAAELGFFADGDSTWVVAVPAWDAVTGDGGDAAAKLPATALAWTFEFADGRARQVTDERAHKDLGRVTRWTATSDAAGGLVFRVR